MFKNRASKSAATQSQILTTALHLFRTRGFDETTMREIAKNAGVALGGAYYYFPSKEAIVLAYYHTVQEEHERRVAEAVAGMGRSTMGQRLALAMQIKIDIIASDQKLLGALFRYAGVPSHPLSFFGPATKPLRDRSIALFARLIEGEQLPVDVRHLLPLALWAMHMGSMLYFLYDDSAGQKRTRRLIEGGLEITDKVLKIIKLPLLRGVRKQILDLLNEARLLPQGE